MTQEWEPSVSMPTGQSPLRKFKGKLVEIGHDDVTFEESGRTSRNILFNFTELQVMEAIEVYPFETAQISIRYADPSRSRGATLWAAFSKSVREILGAGAPISGLLDKRQEWAFLPGAPLRERLEDKSWVDTTGEAWIVTGVEGMEGEGAGAGSVDLMARIADLADGKTEKAFLEALFQDALLRADSGIVTAATDRKLLAQLQEAGLVSVDEQGILHKTEGGAA